jgi:outer membrane immunogenic protein
MKIRSALLTTASSMAMLGIASAADLPVKAPPRPVVVTDTWAGWYIGVTGGVARHDWVQNADGPGSINDELLPGAGGHSKTGAIFGGHVGVNWQSGGFVYGIEADGNWLDVKHSIFSPSLSWFSDGVTRSSKIDWLVTVRGRAGLAVGPNLVYLTGGVAFAKVTNGWFGDKGNGLTEFGSGKKTKTGWVVGGGFERMITSNWTVRAEVLHVDLGRTNATPTIAATGETYGTSFTNKLLIARLGASLKW